jgi:hypothetical protein
MKSNEMVRLTMTGYSSRLCIELRAMAPGFVRGDCLSQRDRWLLVFRIVSG